MNGEGKAVKENYSCGFLCELLLIVWAAGKGRMPARPLLSLATINSSVPKALLIWQ
jgi:hypothetical protein